MNHEERCAQAQGIYRAGLKRAANITELPAGQKYPPGTRVRIAEDLGSSMAHFESGCNATVRYTYAQAYGGGDVKSYCLDIDGHGEVSWYYEHQLTPIPKSVAKPSVSTWKDLVKAASDEELFSSMQGSITWARNKDARYDRDIFAEVVKELKKRKLL